MVPIPDKLSNARTGRPSRHTDEAATLRICCPDWHGLVLPPLKEAAKKDRKNIWYDVYKPDYTAAEKEQDRWSYGALNVMMRTLIKKKYDPGHWLYVSRPVDVALRHVKKEDKEIYTGKPFWVYKDFDEIDVKKALRDVEAWMRANPDKFPPEAIEDFKKLFPVAVEAAKPIGKFMKVLADKAREEMKRRGDPNYTPADYLRDMVKEQGIPPQLHLPNYLTQEEIEKIHLAHRLLYELLGMHARVMFEKKSGMEELLGEERVRELEEEVQRLKRGEHLKKIFGETPTRKTAAVPRPPVVQKRTAPPRQVQEEKQRTATQQPAKKVPFTIDDVDMNKVEKHPETRLPIIRNGDEIIVLPPHKHPKEIPDLHPEAVSPGTSADVYYTIVTSGITDPGEFEKAARTAIKMLEDYRKAIQEYRDISKAAQKILNSLDKYKDGSKATDVAVEIMRQRIKVHNFEKGLISGYTADHALSELAPSEVQLRETLKVAVDALKHPEKYGIRAPKEITKPLYKAQKRIKGFPHKRHV